MLIDCFDGDRRRLCEALEADPSSVWRYLTGKRVPREDKLRRLARVSRISLSWLLRGAPDAPFSEIRQPPAPDLLPVYRSFLSCSPECVRGTQVAMRPVAPQLAGPTRYYYEVAQPVMPGTWSGDFLLVEANRGQRQLSNLQRDWVVLGTSGCLRIVWLELDPQETAESGVPTACIVEFTLRPRGKRGTGAFGWSYRAALEDSYGLSPEFESSRRALDTQRDWIVGRVLLLMNAG